MADIEPSDPSLVAPVAVTPIQTVAWEAGNLEKREHEVVVSLEESAHDPQKVTQSPNAEDRQQSNHDLSQSLNSDDTKTDNLRVSVSSEIVEHTTESTTVLPPNIDPDEKLKHGATGINVETPNSIPSTVSSSPVQQHATTTHSLHPPQIKRFTSVNITKRFLEKTSSMSGPSLGTSSISNTNLALNSSIQHRGVSPNSRSPSFDRPVSSRLVTAKLTAVPQPSSASTTGWLRPGQTTSSATTPTPPSTSPQPPLHESTTSLQTTKRRPGTSPAPNGTPLLAGLQSNKPVWAKVTAANPVGKNPPGLENQNDFPTAAEAVHSMQSVRKGKSGKGQAETDAAAAAQRTAQTNALNETAAAFRGTHLDANARWDEMMSDSDSEDFDGVIEFGDGTQYKIEHKSNVPPGTIPERPKTPSEPEGPPVAKEERFGEDMGRSWPRRQAPPSGQPSIDRPSLQLSVSLHPTSEAPTQSHSPSQSPHDNISPTSRVLFNERLNRLEPLSESKAPFQSRQRESPPAPQTYASNIQLLQKGLPGTDFKSRGPPRGFGSGTDRGPWNDNAPFRGPPHTKDDERPWGSRRRESVSSATGSSIRDRSRGRENRWEPPHHATGTDRENAHRAPNAPPLPPALTRERDGYRGGQFRPPPFAPVPWSKGAEGDNSQSNFSNASPAISTRSLHSPVLEKSQLTASQPTSAPEELDKNALLKDAMHLANERARRRKQELDEEERRREEAAERARKKAEALASAMEEKPKPESQTSLETSRKLVNDDERKHEPKSVTGAPTGIAQTGRGQLNKLPIGQPPPTNVNPPPLLLSRRSTASMQVESWRSKAPLKSPATEAWCIESIPTVKINSQTGSSASHPHGTSVSPSLPSQLPPDLHDLSIKPDEQVEVVDFEDLGEFLGNPPQETSLSPKPPPRSNRPVASDFFKEDSLEPEPLSWRRQAAKPQPNAVVDGLRTQTIPIFPTEPSPEMELSAAEQKVSQSPSMSPSKRLPYGDQQSNNPQVSPVLSALRSPRASHFKEAPMSALTDTMSRIKGALDGMQSQDMPAIPKALEKVSADKARPSVIETRRTVRDDVSHQNNSGSLLLEKPEDFVSRAPPPPSPKPVWNTYTVKIPKSSQQREPLPKKQIHFWNLPYPPVRWEILSWDPPVEGMNKRDLSRDDIFHRRGPFKSAKPRVLLPPPNSQQVAQAFSKDTITVSTTVVTETGVKVKLPNGPSTFRPTITTSQPDSMENTRVNVPSWRRSANPSGLAKTEQSYVAKEELNTTSRSPPPVPSTPLPQSTPTKKETPTKFEDSLPANVSLPPAEIKPMDRVLCEPVSFLRARGSAVEEQSVNSLLPNFTVGSELETFTSDPLDHTVKATVTNSAPELGQVDVKSLPSFAPTSHEVPTSLPRLTASKPGSKSSEESTTRPETPPPSTQHTTSPWGKALAFPVKDSPTRRGPDPEHLKAVWSQTTSISTGSTSNSLKGISDDLPFIPSTVQDMKSEGEETPPPTAPAPPSRLSQQEVARAFQQVPESPASRAPTYPHNSFLPQHHRPGHPAAISHPMRPSYPPSYHAHSVMSHSPSPTLVYAPGIGSPVSHQRMPVNGPSPPGGVWLQTPPPMPAQHGTYLRPAGAPPPPPAQMVYPSGAAHNQMMHHRMPMMTHGSIPPAPPLQAGGMYAHTHAPMPDARNMQVRSPHMAHATAAHPHAVQMQTMQTMHHPMFSPPPGHAGQPQAMYALPVGAGRGTMIPRDMYGGYPTMPHTPGYPNTPYIYQP